MELSGQNNIHITTLFLAEEHSMRTYPKTIVMAVFLVIATAVTSAADVQISYQGRLTDPGGSPVSNGLYSITFRIYQFETGGTSLWNEIHPDIQVTDGLFSVVLGAVTPLSETTLNPDPLYLSIQVGGDPEISPRSRFYPVPKAATAKSVKGDLETGQGYLNVDDVSGNPALQFDATTKSGATSLRMLNTSTGFFGQTLTEMSTDADGGALSLYHAGDLPNSPTIRMGVEPSPFRRGTIKMFNPQPEPPALYMELYAEQGMGAGINIFDDIGQVMGLEPTPFNSGFAMNLYNTGGAEPLAERLAQVSSNYDGNGGFGRIAAYSRSNLGGDSDSSVMTSGAVAMYMGPAEIVKLDFGGLNLLSLDCSSGRGTMNVKYGGCGMIVEDTTSDTLMRIGVDGIFLGGTARALSSSYFGETDLKLPGGSAGYVLTSNPYGVGTWQPASAGSDNDWCENGTVLTLCNQRGIGSAHATMLGAFDTTHINMGINCSTGVIDSDRNFCTVTGGQYNSAKGNHSFVGGGLNNDASGNFSVAAGGFYSYAGNSYATVGGGRTNEATGTAATIAGGWLNTASGFYSAIPGGAENDAEGMYSLAGGRKGKALHDGSMVFCANTNINDSVMSGGNEQIVFYADGGIFITDSSQTAPYNTSRLINTKNGAYLSSTGVWTNSSSRELKENFRSVDNGDILRRIGQLSIQKWNYKGDAGVSHIGPVAEDFYGTFGLGSDDKSVSTVDPSGVALAGIKSLIEENKKLKESVADLLDRIERLERNSR